MTNFKRFMMMIVAVATLSFNSCKKDNFDEPPTETVDPNIPVTHTIRELKDLFGGTNLKLTDDIVISGVVVANDKSGNIFNQIIIDDGTAGISIAIDQNALFGEFPVGRKIYVKCKDLYLAASNNLLGIYGALDITGSTVEIPASLITKYVVKANTGFPVVPIEIISISRLNDSFQNRLIKILDVEFLEIDANKPFADAVNKSSVSRIYKQCNGTQMIVRTSGYADFASKLTPKGKGSITGIYTVYRTDKQLLLRNAEEADMNGIKCDGSDPNAVAIFSENFDSYARYSTVIGSWTNYLEAGSKLYKIDSFSSNKYAVISAFGSGESSNISWFVSPVINLDASTNEKLSFATEVGFYRAGTLLEVYISTNFTGNPTTATWTLLNPRIATQSDIISGNYSPFISSGAVDISTYSGNVFIAFKYTGSATNNQTSTFEIDNFKVTGQ